jgi:hypothetical protein
MTVAALTARVAAPKQGGKSARALRWCGVSEESLEQIYDELGLAGGT